MNSEVVGAPRDDREVRIQRVRRDNGAHARLAAERPVDGHTGLRRTDRWRETRVRGETCATKTVWPGSGVSAARGIYGRSRDLAARSPSRSAATQIAESLVGRRDRLLRQLPRQIKLARRLTADQHESVDRRGDRLPRHREQGRRRRRRRAGARLLEGRGPPGAPDVRGPLQHGPSRLEARRRRRPRDPRRRRRRPRTPSSTSSSARRSRSSPPSSRARSSAVLAVKYSGAKELGRFEIARLLGRKPHEIRRSERAIVRKLKAFSAIVAAGRLCDERHDGARGARLRSRHAARSPASARAPRALLAVPRRVHEPGPRDQVRAAAARDRPDPAAAGDRCGRAPPRAVGDRRRLAARGRSATTLTITVTQLGARRPRRSRRSPERSS